MEATKIILCVLREEAPVVMIPRMVTGELEECIFKFLKANRLVSLFYDKIKENQAFSFSFLQELKEASRHEMLRMLQMEGVFTHVLPLLEAEGMQPVVIKGFSLSALLYKHTYHRPMADIDLLVPPALFDRSLAVLAGAGAIIVPAPEAEAKVGVGFDRTLIYRGVKIELHHHLMNPGFKDALSRETVFAHTRQQQILGKECTVLAPAMQLFYLLHHLGRHWDYRLARFIWVMDIHYFLGYYKDSIQWDAFFALVAEAGSHRRIYRGLYLCEVLFGDTLPTGVPACRKGESLAMEYMTLCRHEEAPFARVGSFKVVRQLKGWSSKVSYIREKIFPSDEYLRKQFHLEEETGKSGVLWKHRIFWLWMKVRKLGSTKDEVRR